MNRKAIVLTEEEWDRVIELLDSVTHPDCLYLKTKLSNQLLYTPSDQSPTLPPAPTFVKTMTEMFNSIVKKDL